VLLAAVRRFLLLLVAVTAGVAVVSLLLGLALDASLSRALSLGFYAVGAFLLVSGFFMGSRGPARLRGQPGDARTPSPRRPSSSPSASRCWCSGCSPTAAIACIE
jgi:hypothetical protein